MQITNAGFGSTNAGQGPVALEKAAREFEAVLLNTVFEEMAKSSGDALFGSSPDSEMYQSWFRSEVAKQWSEGEGVGLAQMIEKSLRGQIYPAPVDGVLTSGFGERQHPVAGDRHFHNGVDLAAPEGTEIRAPFPGRVEHVADDPQLGLSVTLSHPGGFRTVYGHQSKIDVKVGDELRTGARIGLTGQSGRTTGPHLHFAMYRGEQAVDPAQWFNFRRVAKK